MNFIDNCVQTIKKHSPEILVGLGITGVVVGTVIACKETKKIDPIIEEHKTQMDSVHKCALEGSVVNTQTNEVVEYTEKDKNRDTFLVYTKTGFKLVKLYLPATLIIGGSIACILGSHKIMTERNNNLAGAYVSISTAFNEYRKKVAEKYGEQVDAELRYGIKAKKKKNKDDETEYEMPENPEDILNTAERARFIRQKITRDDPNGSRTYDASKTLRLSNINQNKISVNRYLKERKGHTISLNEVCAIYDVLPFEDGYDWGYKYDPNMDPVDGNGMPMIFDPDIFCFDKRKNTREQKTVSELINDDNNNFEIDYEETLIDFAPGLVPLKTKRIRKRY